MLSASKLCVTIWYGFIQIRLFYVCLHPMCQDLFGVDYVSQGARFDRLQVWAFFCWLLALFLLKFILFVHCKEWFCIDTHILCLSSFQLLGLVWGGLCILRRDV
eukprot:TRINITY_DN2634_c1_g2_i3.p5 TRINITY_DN2634_c1_g2~~TRINITY_DN2634_c1_g2_i3.p5  ORF type:complete len:104 (+),score=2.50 TRINITY_DN2634_c1_g2_i3:379-690(+)